MKHLPDFLLDDHNPADPNPWLALYLDQSTPLPDPVKRAWLADSSSPSRQYLLPFVRPLARTAIVLIQVLKVFVPKRWSASRLMHRLLAAGLTRFVSPEANWLVLRHFHLGSQVLAFIAANAPTPVKTSPLRPTRITDLEDELFVKHDLNLFNFVINLNRALRDAGEVLRPVERPDFSMIDEPPVDFDTMPRRWTNFIDLQSAIEIFTPVYQFFLTDNDFWRASNSLQLDETIGVNVATILSSHEQLVLLNNKHPLVPLSTLRAGHRLVLHGLSTEMLHQVLTGLKAAYAAADAGGAPAPAPATADKAASTRAAATAASPVESHVESHAASLVASTSPQVHTAARDGFTQATDRYARGRPDYPAALTAWLRDSAGIGPGCAVVDLGAGTGKFTGLLVGTGAQVTAVEPVDAMRATLQQTRPGVLALAGTAQAMPLADASVDVVVCAQAFHWFATREALAEIHRVLRPGGALVLVWNVRDERTDWVAALTDIVRPLEGNAPRHYTGAWRQSFSAVGEALFGPLTVSYFDHVHHGSPETVIVDRFMSVSFIAALPPEPRAEVQARLRALCIEHPGLRGREAIDFPYRTEVWMTRRLPD